MGGKRETAPPFERASGYRQLEQAKFGEQECHQQPPRSTFSSIALADLSRRSRLFRHSLERLFDAVLQRAAERREAQDRPRRGGVLRRAPQRPRAESAA